MPNNFLPSIGIRKNWNGIYFHYTFYLIASILIKILDKFQDRAINIYIILIYYLIVIFLCVVNKN